jgi:hypothetical protein
VKGTNTSPFSALTTITADGEFNGLTLGYGYTGTVNAGGSLNINGNVSIFGGTLTADSGSNLKLGVGGNPDVLSFGEAYFEGTPTLDMDVNITTATPADKPPVPVTMNIQGPGTIDRTVTNAGNLNFVPGQSFTVTGPNIANTSWGVVEIQGEETFGGPGYYLSNIGVLEKSYDTGTATTASYFLNQGKFVLSEGTLHLTNTLPTQSQNPQAGSPVPETRFSGGTLWVDSPYLVLGGWVDGNGTLQGVLDNGDPTGRQQGAGIVHPGLLNASGQPNPDGTWGSGGQITVTGDFQQTSNGILWIDVTQSYGGSSMGHLQVNGTAFLAGEAEIVRGSQCTPGLGMGNWNFINWGNLSGDFNVISFVNNGWTTPDGKSHSFTDLREDTDYTLVVV